jgi:CelD/BcsL family acetyltransferase involved in cellulose biosynthesis
MYTNLINGSDVFTELASEWDALAQQGITDTPFQTWAYQRGWWQHLQPDTATLHTVTVYEDGGNLLAIASLYLLEGVLYFNGSMEETDYLDLIVREGKAEAAWTAVFDCICSPDFPQWDALDLWNIPEASPSRAVLPTLAQERGFSFAESQAEVCPTIPLSTTFEGYLSQIDSKQRREIQRKLRRADGAGVQITQVSSDDDVKQAVDDFLALLQQSTLEKRDWLNDGRRALFYDVAQAAQQAGTLQLLFAEVDGRKAATLFNFDYKDRIWVYNSGLDPASFGALSLGVIISAKAIEMATENGRIAFDFLRGDEIYKYRFGAEDTRIYRIQIKRDE